MTETLLILLNALTIGMILFAVAVGLSLVFGLMHVLNLAHGVLFVLGAYLAHSLLSEPTLGRFGLAVLAAAGLGAVAGAILSRLTIPIAHRGVLPAALVTLGVSMIATDGFVAIWGNDVESVPSVVSGSVSLLGSPYPSYRLLMLGVGVAIAIGVVALVERTRLGASMRATVLDPGMAEAVGINTRRLTLGVFAGASALAAVGGVLAGPLFSPAPGLDVQILNLALIVVVLGGLGSVLGTLYGALTVALVQSISLIYVPHLTELLIFLVMAAVLVLRPAGLAGVQKAVRA